ncbi:MAG: DUF2141 domain-containing protein [Bacteroidia bacterium]|jgi:uncharacterized protein (DUF2141 family)|nr:DUF2141 domain-containing protein [Bacteroidia bacterium]
MKKKIFIIIFSLLIFPLLALNAQNVEVVISGIRSEKGQIVIGVFKDNESFKIEKAFLSKKFVKKGVSKGEMTVKFDLEAGTWGLSLLDDENSNGKMEYSFIKIPKEGFGFSDYYHTGLKKPKFDAFKFDITDGQKQKISIRMKYM